MRELDTEDITAVLRRNGLGVLALDGGVAPYPIPVAFGYDPEEDTVVLQLEGTDGDKHRCLDHNSNVGLAVYEEVEQGAVWQSVVLQGTLEEIAYQEAEAAFAALARNTQGAPNPVVWSDDPGELTPYRLRIDERGGREFVID
jgi:nitroimidazol reductase NimA-like FMN-containing flavoprotein (pyridoxamine 5'-phosphate oxidase superfamily)